MNDAHAIADHFRRFDRDGNGSVDFQEFRGLLTELGLRRSHQMMRQMFDLIDRDGDGQITLAEFSAWWPEHEADS